MKTYILKSCILPLTFLIVIAGIMTFFSCGKVVLKDKPLGDFIYYASQEGLPVSYLETINDQIKIQYRARPAYAGSTIYLTETFDDYGTFIPYYKLDSFEVSSVFHEGFHAYIDLFVRQGKASEEMIESYYSIMEDSLDYYTETADGRNILWKNYRRQASEEAMAIHITNLVKYKIVYEKNAEKAARNYIYGAIDRQQLEDEIRIINGLWQDVIDGKRSRGYYNKSFLRWKFPHIIDAEKYVSEKEIDFVTRFILPGIDSPIGEPPLTAFISGCKTDDLPYDFLIGVNKNHFWDEGLVLEPYEEMSPERVSQVYVMALDVYWDKILKRDMGIRMSEREAFQSMLGSAIKWYTGPVNDPAKIETIIKNAAVEYVGNVIYEKVKWQEDIKGDLLGAEDLDSTEFVMSWREAIEGRQVFGFYLDDGIVIRTPKAMTLDEKLFITSHILPDICYSFAPFIVAEPAAANSEIEAETRVFSDLTGSEG
jgi:hypothetical protein